MDEDQGGFCSGVVSPIDEVEFELLVLRDAMRNRRRRVMETDAGAFRCRDCGVE